MRAQVSTYSTVGVQKQRFSEGHLIAGDER